MIQIDTLLCYSKAKTNDWWRASKRRCQVWMRKFENNCVNASISRRLKQGMSTYVEPSMFAQTKDNCKIYGMQAFWEVSTPMFREALCQTAKCKILCPCWLNDVLKNMKKLLFDSDIVVRWWSNHPPASFPMKSALKVPSHFSVLCQTGCGKSKEGRRETVQFPAATCLQGLAGNALKCGRS